MQDVLERIKQIGVIPVVSIEDLEHVAILGEALIKGGGMCAEITYRTKFASEAIHDLAQTYPEILIGAGTVLTKLQANEAVSSGARFIVSPGFDEGVVTWCLDNDITVIPGVSTPTEINLALGHGLRVVKFFPAEALGGVQFLKAISAPYRSVHFIPTGGINEKNLANYLSLPSVYACGGSWVARQNLISSGDVGEIIHRIRESIKIKDRVRG